MLFGYLVPFKALEAGPEFYNNMNASKNSRGPENDEAAFYNNMAASRNQAGPENDEVCSRMLQIPCHQLDSIFILLGLPSLQLTIGGFSQMLQLIADGNA